MKELNDKILKDGVIKPGHIVKVDAFLNHQVDVEFMKRVGEEFHRRYKDSGVTKIVTIESSGVPIAFATAECFRCPMVFAKKGESINQSSDFYQTKVYSYTYQKEYIVRVAKEYLSKGDKILIIDDFLANGAALNGIIDLVSQSGAEIVGCGIVIEKGFQPGGKTLRERGVRVESLAIIDEIDEAKQKIVFRGE